MAWHQLSIISDKNTAPKISDFFSTLGAVSVTYMDAEDQPVFEPAVGETQIWRLTKIIALFELDTEPELVKKLLFSTFNTLSSQHWYHEVLQDQAWERTWMEHYQPMKFGDRLWVCASGQKTTEQEESTNTIYLTLDPGLAFGTGTHPTTALCLEWLATHNLNGKTVIDYGCGSGILAIASLLLGAKQAHAIDIDPQAIEATQYNAEKNQMQDKIKSYLPEQFSPFKADIVIANILAKPLCELAESISNLIKPGGQLILSGILNEQAETVSSAYQSHHIQLTAPISEGDWCRLNGIKDN